MKINFSTWSRKKKVIVSVVAAFFALGLVGSVFGEDPETSRSNSSTETEVTTPKTTVAQSPTEILKARVEKEAGSKSNIDGYSARVRTVSVEDGQVTIEMNGQENISDGTTKSANRRLVLDAITALKASGVTYETAFIAVYFPLVDNLGGTSMDPVLRYTFSSAQIMRIQPDNVDTKGMDSNFADLGTSVHPAFAW